MLNLEQHKISDLHLFYNNLTDCGMASTLYKKVQASNLDDSVKSFLKESKIQEILDAKPAELIELHHSLNKLIYKKYSEAEYFKFLKALAKKKGITKRDKNLISRYNKTRKTLIKIFDYEKYISSKKTKSYSLSKLIGKNTCTYCNRIYTFTVIRKDVRTRRVNNSTRITRPQFDHWFPKKKYPLLALSFYNLIPSCSVCNSSVKSDDNYSLETHIHPYIDESDNQNFKFSYSLKPDNKNEVIIKVQGSKMAQTLKDLKVKEIYDEHSDYELQELLDLRYKYTDNYLDILFNKTFKLSDVNKKDAYRMLFGVEIDPKDFHKRPFSKFKYDILKELKIIR